MPIPDNQLTIAQVALKGTVASAGSTGHTTAAIFYFRRTSNVNVIAETAIDTAFQAAYAALIGAVLNIRWLQTANEIRMIEDATRVAVSVPHNQAGLVVGDSMPMENHIFILARSALRGRNYRGGKRFFPLSESDTVTATADLIKAAVLTNWQAFCTAWLAGFSDSNGNVWKPCVFSRKLSQVKVNPTTVVTADVVQLLVNQRVSSSKKHKVASVY